jgi:hypothetical protein
MIIVNAKGKHFDPDMVDAFLEIHEQFRNIARDMRFAGGKGVPQAGCGVKTSDAGALSFRVRPQSNSF